MGKIRVTFLRGELQFFIKEELKSKIFKDKKKLINKNVFLCHNSEFKLVNFNLEFSYF